MSTILVCLALFGWTPPSSQPAFDDLRTVAESSDYRATGRYDDVVKFLDALAERSPVVRRAELGTTVEGRSIPLVILADPPVATPEQALRSRKLVVFAFGGIHAGEICGKEALCTLARDIASVPKHPLLKDLIVVLAPILNCDGNEKVSKDNRPGQNGPEDGMGERHNAAGLDLNRDFIKLESPEIRGLVRFLRNWDPALIIDTHTTNGSYHRYTITYAGPHNPAGDSRVIEFTRDKLLSAVTEKLEKDAGYKSFFYGNFDRERTRWESFGAEPRLATNYFGLRNRIGILSEAYSYAPFRERVQATGAFVRCCLEYAAENKDEFRRLIRQADDDARRDPGDKDTVAVRSEAAAFESAVTIEGYVEELRDGRRVATDQPKSYEVRHFENYVAAQSVARPYAYLFPASLSNVVDNLQRHGIEVEELREDVELDIEIYQVDRIERASRAFQNHRLATVTATAVPKARRLTAGTVFVRTGQPLGALAVNLLEPGADDGLATWNYFEASMTEGGEFPVMRMPRSAPVLRCALRPLAEDRETNKPVTFDSVYRARSRGRRGFGGGGPVSGFTWLDDGEHFLQTKEGRLRKVHAVTGRSEPFHDPDKVADSLRSLPTIGRRAASALAGRATSTMNKARTAALLDHENDLYHCLLDGTHAVRLTRTPQQETYTTISPDGQFVAFVRDHNLCVVDVATQTDRALTTDGSDKILNGHADWVYAEEVYGHGRPLHWWSPDSTHMAFLQIDTRPVHEFTIVNHGTTRQTNEVRPYPKPGDPNPLARLGVVSAAGGSVRWIDLSDYDPPATLITRVGWSADGQSIYCYVQDRAQTWLDFLSVPRDGGKPTRLFRETTGAWVDEPGEPEFLKDGSFLFLSQRTGWQHIYHYGRDGKLIRQLTDGDWEVRRIDRVDEESGRVYFTGTRDSHIAGNLYRVRLEGGEIERLTQGDGDHRASVGPGGEYFIDTWSDHRTPPQVRLHAADGSLVRTLDANPVYELEEYRFGTYELLRIPMSDGFELEGSLLLPPDFDPDHKYPVWFMTYGGPHAPTIRNAWGGGRNWDQVLAQLGIVVFRCDPRPASGKGAVSAWTNYRRLGVQELADIEEAIRWLSKKPFVDADRIGMSGHSYGGFMTAYAMTHSKLFAAGIAGAPVTDWRLYDTIYTERYMDTPQNNPEGYGKTSVVKAAADLHGRLLILHGAVDDNVHVQNTMQLVRALQQADKQFELMIYPENRHGLYGPHYQRLMYDFIRRTLGVPEPTPTRPAKHSPLPSVTATR